MPRPRKTRVVRVAGTHASQIAYGGVTEPPGDVLWPLPATLGHYRMTLSRFKAMYVEQDASCAICHTKRVPTGLFIDHNHKTRKVRGLLCPACNTGLGFFKDSPDLLEAALEYLEQRGCYGPDALAEERGA